MGRSSRSRYSAPCSASRPSTGRASGSTSSSPRRCSIAASATCSARSRGPRRRRTSTTSSRGSGARSSGSARSACGRSPRSRGPRRSRSRTAAGVVLVSRRAGIVAAALVATNPFLVWYSQEARSYALLALLGARSVLAFGLALRGERRVVGGVGLVSAPSRSPRTTSRSSSSRAEAVWLLVRCGRGSAGRAVACLVPGRDPPRPSARAPRPARQRRGGRGLVARGAGRRDPEEPRRRLQLSARGRGQRSRRGRLVLVGLVLVVRLCARTSAAARWSQARSRPRPSSSRSCSRRRRDFVIARNAIVAVVPAAVCVGAGLAARRAGSRRRGCAAVALCAPRRARPGASTRRTVAPTGAALPRRSATTGVPRAIVVTPYDEPVALAPVPARARASRTAPTPRCAEIVVVGLATEGGYSAGGLEPPDAWTRRQPVPGFRVAAVERKPTFTLVRYRRGAADGRAGRRRSPASR